MQSLHWTITVPFRLQPPSGGWWLLLVPSEGSDRFALIYAHFAFVTVLCDPLRGPCHLFDPFPIICISFFFFFSFFFG
jgi:hypothetical protein